MDRIGKTNGIFALAPQQCTPYGSSTRHRLKAYDPICTAAMEFDPIPSHAYNASYHGWGSSRRIACCKESERPWLFLNDLSLASSWPPFIASTRIPLWPSSVT